MTDAELAPKLTDRDRWVCWTYEVRDDEETKPPIAPFDNRKYASTTDPDTWGSYEVAVTYHERDDTDTEGVGYVLGDGDMVAGADLDGCRVPETGEKEPWADEIIEQLDSYTEISPSGTGLRIFVVALMPDGGNRKPQERTLEALEDCQKDSELEMYDEGRYLTFTGNHLEGTPTTVEQRNSAFTAVHEEFIAEDEAQTTLNETGEQTPPTLDLTDEEILAKARNAKNGEKFRQLKRGHDPINNGGKSDTSYGDKAFCQMLAFWTGGNRQQMDRLFRNSDRMRAKWDEDRGDRTYGERTIKAALADQTEFYEPSTAADGGVAAVNPQGSNEDDTDAAPTTGRLSPMEVFTKAWPNRELDEDESYAEAVGELTDREAAAWVWELIKLDSNTHVRVLRDNAALWACDACLWEPDGERALRQAARQALSPINYGQNVLAELKAQAKSDPAVEIETDELGLDPGFVAVENGLLELDTGTIRDLTPEDHALTQLPVTFDPDATYEQWAALVEEWAEDGMADALQEYVGYCLEVGGLPIHRALLLVGSGANGKGVFLSVVRALLGGENTTSIELQTLANERDALADFHGSLANIDDDLSARKLGQGMGMFKKLIAGDRVRARRLYEDGFEYDPTGKHLYAANEVPDVSADVPEDDEGFWRRWLLIEFPNHYSLAERDPELTDTLTEPDVLSGVLNWAIEGYHRLLKQGYFTNEERYAQAKRERWQAWGDSVEKFISNCVEHDPDAENISTTQVHRRFAAWCRQNNEKPIGQQKLTNTLKQEAVDYSTSVRVDGKVRRGYKALGLSDDVPSLEETPERSQQSQLV